LREKQCDFICANDITRMDTGFDADHNEITIFFRDGSQRNFPRATKLEIARAIVKICTDIAELR
jgi:phosphopantothenoylcysteine decarboxylase/phosphopantothenate--cysteine ligase